MTASSSVSVIIPAFNAERFLAEALDSAFSQTLLPWEVIVVNDGSTDATAEVAQRYGSRITYIEQANQGTGAARNAGIAKSTGEFISFLDSDDIWEPRKLELQTAAFDADPALDLVFGFMKCFGAGLAVDQEEKPGVMPGTLMVRRSSFLRVGALSTVGRVADLVAWLMRAREMGLKEKVLPQVVMRRRVHDTNVSVARADEKYHNFLVAIKGSLDRRRPRPPAS